MIRSNVAAVRVLMFHGYLLRGTGSNVYTANLAAALTALGHDVHVICQERHAADFDFVGAVADWDSGALAVRAVREGGCTVYRPDIGGLLPVYVADRYEGVEARPFQELTDDQLETYLVANVRAVREVASRCDPDVALANHLVMGPVILVRALSGTPIPYAVKVHGSALEYTVKPHPRFLPYAREGLAGAATVLVGSRHVAESLWAALEDSSLPARTRLGPPGVDVHSFRPRARDEAIARVDALADRIADQVDRAQPADPEDSVFSRDDDLSAGALRKLSSESRHGPVVGFLGKLIVAKGIDLLLAAWPLVMDAVPSARLLVIGFGAYEAAAQRWIETLSAGDLGAVQELAVQGRAAEGGPPSRLELVLAFLAWLDSAGMRERYLSAARSMSERVILTGRLEHEELAEVLPLCEAIVVPSTFPESFGMVAVEAAACGALPISAAHSGLAEVSRLLSQGLPPEAAELMSFPIGRDSVIAIADCVAGWLRAPEELRQTTRASLVGAVRSRYSWEGVARDVIAAARGEHAALEGVC